jgi:hypothetical protein
MGWCMTWFAVRGKTPETVRAELGVHATGQSIAFPAPHIAGATLPGSWYLVQRNRYECHDDTVPGRLSVGCEVISLFVEEHIMVSRLSGWKDGRRLWSVVHDSEKGDQHLEASGDLPSDFAPIRDEVRARSNEMPHFAIPCRLAEKLTGYRYDAPAKEQIAFEVLALPPWWKRIFAR